MTSIGIISTLMLSTMMTPAGGSNDTTPSPSASKDMLERLSFERDVPLKSLREEYNSLWNDSAYGHQCESKTRDGDDGDGEEFFDAAEYCDDHDENGALKSRALHGIRCGHHDANGALQSCAPHGIRRGHVADLSRQFEGGHREQSNYYEDDLNFVPYPPPPPPRELPIRFLRAGKGDPQVGWQRYQATLAWRKEIGMDTILTEAHTHFPLIKANYPHFYHLRSRTNQVVFYEKPPQTNLAAMKAGGVDMDGLLRHYAMVGEFQWQFLERDDFARSITVIDLEGMRWRDFAGDTVEYIRKCSAFTGQHYPERAGVVLVINVPSWFKVIWNVVKPMVDEVTLKKIRILRGKKEVFDNLSELIPVENIPPEYGGTSVPLGHSPEEKWLRDLMHHNLEVAAGSRRCGGKRANCPFCNFVPARSY